MTKAGLKYELRGGKDQYPVPLLGQLDKAIIGPDKLNYGDWADVADSLGLALYALEQYNKKAKK